MEQGTFSMSPNLPLTLRPATLDDVPALTALITSSVRTLHSSFYTQAEIEGSLASVYGVDTTLVNDGNYLVVTTPIPNSTFNPDRNQEGHEKEVSLHEKENRIIACGGWSFRSTLYGGDQFSFRDGNNLLDPEIDAAKIRALLVHPDFARFGIGSMMLARCEEEARKKGFKRCEMGATFAGVPFYSVKGYKILVEQGIDGVEERNLGNGEVLRLVRMGKGMEQERSIIRS
jgi:GNAT superfamily N-acetyltransferase